MSSASGFSCHPPCPASSCSAEEAPKKPPDGLALSEVPSLPGAALSTPSAAAPSALADAALLGLACWRAALGPSSFLRSAAHGRQSGELGAFAFAAL